MREPDWHTARALARRADPLPAETIPVADADGRTLAEDALALTDLPAFDTSAMDGWAVSGDGPWDVVGEILAGHTPGVDLHRGQACVIATGAAVPPGATAVVRREAGTTGAQLHADHVPGAHIRPAGEECRRGEVLAGAGGVLSPATVGLLSAAGLDDVRVRRVPLAAIVLFGDELVDHGVAGVGRVRDCLGPQLPGWLVRMGVATAGITRASDTLDEHVDRIRRASATADVVITTGGTAAGPVDHVHAAVEVLGGRFVVDSVAVRPGHPMALARVGNSWLLALPGNPQSAIVSLLTLGQPLFDALLGRPEPSLATVTMAHDAPAPATEHRLLAAVHSGAAVTAVAHLGSAMLRGLSTADGFAILPPGGVRTGEPVGWLPLP